MNRFLIVSYETGATREKALPADVAASYPTVGKARAAARRLCGVQHDLVQVHGTSDGVTPDDDFGAYHFEAHGEVVYYPNTPKGGR